MYKLSIRGVTVTLKSKSTKTKGRKQFCTQCTVAVVVLWLFDAKFNNIIHRYFHPSVSTQMFFLFQVSPYKFQIKFYTRGFINI